MQNTIFIIINVLRIGEAASEGIFLLSKIMNQPSEVDFLLFDTDSQAFGGTGKTFDWGILNIIKIRKPYFLSGGISLENLQQLKTINYQPMALDINSKFETEPGIKDLEKIKEFKSAVRALSSNSAQQK